MLQPIAPSTASALRQYVPGLQDSTINRISKIINTTSTGVPPQFDNAWHWASDWIASHGVTLPPDTDQYRSLRNWFCYQVQQHKKNKLSARSQKLLAQYGIDLSLYRAGNTGGGQLMDDAAMCELLQSHHHTHGTYDLNPQSPAELLAWQERVLNRFLDDGLSARLRQIEQSLPWFRIGLWMRSGETPPCSTELLWWGRCDAFEQACASVPPHNGQLDPRTPPDHALWAQQEIQRASQGRLSARQKAQLISMGLLPRQELLRSRQRAAALAIARQVMKKEKDSGHKVRHLSEFLGAMLLLRLHITAAPPKDVYTELGISPATWQRLHERVLAVTADMGALPSLFTLSLVRRLHQQRPDDWRNPAAGGADVHAIAHEFKVKPSCVRQALDFIPDAMRFWFAVSAFAPEQTLPHPFGNTSPG